MTQTERVKIVASANRDDLGQDFKNFLTHAVSPYHAVGQIIKELTKPTNGSPAFTLINDDAFIKGEVKLEKGGRYITHRNHSAVIAFTVPQDFDLTVGGLTIAAGHTDSPCLRIRPNSDIEKEGYLQVGCELYGGGLWHTWLDRELCMAGKVVVKTGETMEEKLINIDRPIMMIPNLAIHLQTADERAAFKLDKEEHMRPVIANRVPTEWTDYKDGKAPLISVVLAKELGCKPEEILDMDISLYDSNAPRIWGISEEFMASGRLDNQISNFSNLRAIQENATQDLSQDICCMVSFDHEEIGSTTWVGADGDLLPSWTRAIWRGLSGGDWNDSMDAVHRRSILISTDGAHGINPNYASKHQVQHKIRCGDGVAIKTNENARYTTNGYTRAMCKAVCGGSDVKIQNFVVKNSSPCGSTIGPAMASSYSMKALDVGAPMWGMHSIRESCHLDDVKDLLNLVLCFYGNYRFMENDFKHL